MGKEKISLGVNVNNFIPYNVLIVDDSRMDQMLLRQYLQSEMFNVTHVAENGQHAIDILKDYNQSIDIICIDYDMPIKNGVETLKEIKADYPDIATIMITSHPNKEVINEIFKLKVNSLIVKPITKTQVIEKFALVLGRKDLISKSVIAYKNTVGIDINDLKIPPVPSVMLKVLQFDTSTSGGSSELEKIINPDRALSLDILKIANSSFYGRSGSIKSLKDAITLLGMKTVKNLVILQSKKQFSNTLIGSVFKRYINELPILSSLVSFDLTGPLNVKKLRDEIFTFSLLRKIGATILAMNFSKRYQEVLRLSEYGTKSIITIEKEEFNTDSIEVGIKVFRHWGMPDPFLELIRNQNFSIDELASVSDMDRVTRLADIISRKLHGLLVSPEEEELYTGVFTFYEAKPETKDAFGPDYFENIKEHPYFM
ncbi:MAG: HDOD domain-containing protein [Leptospiraceae bacterium]|nr:HDOD domain-containing protein [Leptospiraceae bacterium]